MQGDFQSYMREQESIVPLPLRHPDGNKVRPIGLDEAEGDEPPEAGNDEKEFFGSKGPDQNFYFTRDGEDLVIIDAEGIIVFSAEQRDIPTEDLVDFLISAARDLELDAVAMEVLQRYDLLAPRKDEEQPDVVTPPRRDTGAEEPDLGSQGPTEPVEDPPMPESRVNEIKKEDHPYYAVAMDFVQKFNDLGISVDVPEDTIELAGPGEEYDPHDTEYGTVHEESIMLYRPSDTGNVADSINIQSDGMVHSLGDFGQFNKQMSVEEVAVMLDQHLARLKGQSTTEPAMPEGKVPTHAQDDEKTKKSLLEEGEPVAPSEETDLEDEVKPTETLPKEKLDDVPAKGAEATPGASTSGTEPDAIPAEAPAVEEPAVEVPVEGKLPTLPVKSEEQLINQLREEFLEEGDAKGQTHYQASRSQQQNKNSADASATSASKSGDTPSSDAMSQSKTSASKSQQQNANSSSAKTSSAMNTGESGGTAAHPGGKSKQQNANAPAASDTAASRTGDQPPSDALAQGGVRTPKSGQQNTNKKDAPATSSQRASSERRRRLRMRTAVERRKRRLARESK